MARSPLRAVIFDIGRVLINLDVPRAVAGLSKGVALSPAELWSTIEKDPSWPDFQEGRMSPHDWHVHLTRRLGSPLNFAEFSDAWNRTLDPKPIHGNDLFEGIAKKHKLALLSNTDSIHVAHIEANFEFVRYVPQAARIYSCAVRARKPSPVIFQCALKAVKTVASQAVFIDDILEFVDAARTLGLHGIHYQNPVQLRADLRALDPSLLI